MDLPTHFTELPFAFPGRVFRSRMSFDARDPHGHLFNRFLAESIGVVVVLVVHCHAGMGRTGLFLACLAQRALHMSPVEAIDWVRSYVPGAL